MGRASFRPGFGPPFICSTEICSPGMFLHRFVRPVLFRPFYFPASVLFRPGLFPPGFVFAWGCFVRDLFVRLVSAVGFSAGWFVRPVCVSLWICSRGVVSTVGLRLLLCVERGGFMACV